MNDVYSRADAVINTPSTPTTVHFTWQGHVGEIDATNPPPDVEYDVAEWGTYTYDVDVIEYDANDEMVDWHSYKWPSCLGIGEHKVFARDNEDISGSTLNYRYVLQDIANDDITGYYPNAMDPSELQVLTIDSNLNEVSTNDLEEYIDGQLRGGVAISSTELSSYFDNWRTVYIGQDNCWRADRRDHISSRMLAVNAVVSPSLVLDVFPNDEVAIGTPLSISVIKTKANEAGDLLPVAGAKIRFLVWWEKSRWAYFGMGTTGADGIIATNYVAYAPVDTYPHVKEVNKFMAIEVNDGDYFLPKDPANNALSKSNIREINICD